PGYRASERGRGRWVSDAARYLPDPTGRSSPAGPPSPPGPDALNEAHPAAGGHTWPAMRILVVEDEAAVREALERALELEGYDVALAATGEDGLASLAESPSALVRLARLP